LGRFLVAGGVGVVKCKGAFFVCTNEGQKEIEEETLS